MRSSMVRRIISIFLSLVSVRFTSCLEKESSMSRLFPKASAIRFTRVSLKILKAFISSSRASFELFPDSSLFWEISFFSDVSMPLMLFSK